MMMQPNGANLTGGGIGSAFTSPNISVEPSYTPFNGAIPAALLPQGVWFGMIMAYVVATIGTIGVVSWL